MKERLITGIIFGIFFLGLIVLGGGSFTMFVWMLNCIIIYELYVMAKGKIKKNIILLTLTGIYVTIGFYWFGKTRFEEGLPYILLVLFIIWATDSGAYFIGKKWGKRKLAPKISPNKTWEGTIGGILVALIVAFLFQQTEPLFEKSRNLVFYTLLISITGVIGDLVESAIKRHFNVKDSGKILPGHGGIFDRFDSLILVFFMLYIIQLF